MPSGIDAVEMMATQRLLLTEYLRDMHAPTFWFQTPMALAIAPVEISDAIIYDCMDELSAFHDAPAALAFLEKQLLARADLVFTGGRSLYEAKRMLHPSVHCFPSSIDSTHFARARALRNVRRL